MNTLDENGLGESNVYFPSYKLSSRGESAKERKGPGRRYIAYKDNFATITTSPSVVRPGDMKLSKVKPLSEGKDILDHDPIIGVLQLEKIPSTGKFLLVSADLYLAGTSEDLSTETNCYF